MSSWCGLVTLTWMFPTCLTMYNKNECVVGSKRDANWRFGPKFNREMALSTLSQGWVDSFRLSYSDTVDYDWTSTTYSSVKLVFRLVPPESLFEASTTSAPSLTFSSHLTLFSWRWLPPEVRVLSWWRQSRRTRWTSLTVKKQLVVCWRHEILFCKQKYPRKEAV